MGSANDTVATIVALLRRTMVDRSVESDTDLIETAMFDSASLMELFVLLESEFDIEITAADLDLERFRTIERIAAFVDAKRAGGR